MTPGLRKIIRCHMTILFSLLINQERRLQVKCPVNLLTEYATSIFLWGLFTYSFYHPWGFHPLVHSSHQNDVPCMNTNIFLTFLGCCSLTTLPADPWSLSATASSTDSTATLVVTFTSTCKNARFFATTCLLSTCSNCWFKHILLITRHDKGSGRVKSYLNPLHEDC